jgi:hypothetical protein
MLTKNNILKIKSKIAESTPITFVSGSNPIQIVVTEAMILADLMETILPYESPI